MSATSPMLPMADIGLPAPLFELPSIHTGTITLGDYQGQKNVILWFSRGFTCNFCRGHISDMTRNYAAVQALDTEIIQISPNLLYTAQSYFPADTPPFPFICDPDKRLYAVYGLGDRGVLEATKNTVISFTAPLVMGGVKAEAETIRASWVDTVNRNFLRRLQHHAMTAMEQGVFIIDKQGTIRYRQVLGALEDIPSAEELVDWTARLCE